MSQVSDGLLEPGTDELPLIGRATEGQLHIITFNVRMAVDEPPHSWGERRLLITDLLRREQPTILGTQETLFHQAQDLRADLDGYDWLHLSRMGGSDDQAMTVYFDIDRLRIVDYGHQWLSETPNLMGSATWGNIIPRMLTWARFAENSTQQEFVLINTHFDHESANARQRSADMLRKFAAQFTGPVIITGDFNTAQETAPYQTLTSDGALVDSWETAARQLTPAVTTFTDWNPHPVPDGDRIDWILTTPDITAITTGINTWAPHGLTPSDHWPVQALLSL